MNCFIFITAVDCGQPEKLSNGMVMLVNGSTTYGSVVAYSCSGQLVTLGIFYRVCGAQGRWEGPTADCVAEIPSLIPAESRQEGSVHDVFPFRRSGCNVSPPIT